MLTLKKKFALFIFAMTGAASAAYALPDDGGLYECQRECRWSYQSCLQDGIPAAQCEEYRSYCYENCGS